MANKRLGVNRKGTKYGQSGDAFRALADPSRRKILRLLSDRSLSAGQIAGHFDFTKPTLSRHLKVLREADLIVGERHGTSIRYSANLSVLEDALIGLMNGLGLPRASTGEGEDEYGGPHEPE